MTPRAKFVCLLAISFMIAAVARTEQTRFWKQTSYSEFEKGTPKGVAIRSDGLLAPAPKFDSFADPNLAVNMSVWDSVESLERFVWQTIHKRFYGRRPDWFEQMDKPHLVMWWVPAGHRPTIGEAKERLEYLTAHGPSEHAFGWESIPAAQLWKTARCAAPGGQAA